ncbi:MAG: hypothetical protein V1770_03800 [bacterium]
MKWTRKIITLFLVIIISGCGRRMYYNRPLHTYLPRVFKTSRKDSYSIIPVPKGSFYLVSFKDAFFWENGVSWKVIVFDDILLNVYITFAFDADGDGFLETLIPAEYSGMRFFLVSHDNIVLLGTTSGIQRKKNNCLKDLKWEEIIQEAPILGSDTTCLISEDSSNRSQVMSMWETGISNNLMCKVLTPKQIRDLKRWTPPYSWDSVLNIISNITGIYGIWDPSVWSIDWFKTVRTILEAKYLLSNVLPYPDNSVYGTALLSRLEGADLLWTFEKYKSRKPGYFRKIYLERGGI